MRRRPPETSRVRPAWVSAAFTLRSRLSEFLEESSSSEELMRKARAYLASPVLRFDESVNLVVGRYAVLLEEFSGRASGTDYQAWKSSLTDEFLEPAARVLAEARSEADAINGLDLWLARVRIGRRDEEFAYAGKSLLFIETARGSPFLSRFPDKEGPGIMSARFAPGVRRDLAETIAAGASALERQQGAMEARFEFATAFEAARKALALSRHPEIQTIVMSRPAFQLLEPGRGNDPALSHLVDELKRLGQRTEESGRLLEGSADFAE